MTRLSRNAALLRIDVDRERWMPISLIMQRLRRAGYKLCWMSQRMSPSTRGWHIMAEVRPRPRNAATVVALQLLMGSDPARESCNLQRARVVDGGRIDSFWRERWNVLYD